MAKQFYQINTDLIERIKSVMQDANVRTPSFAEKLGFSRGNLSSILNGKRPAPSSLLESIADTYDVRFNWLLTGEGEMKDEPVVPEKGGIPYFQDLPVSAGHAELQYTDCEENAVGSINIAGISGKYAFPVVGCSMEPVIHAGDIVVVDEVNQWERIDPDKIYLIITRDDRMIKHLEMDEADKAKIWCISPNYKRFSIPKRDIIRLFRVTFYGRLA